MAKDEPQIRVNGATLPQFHGRPVIMLGVMDKIDPSGMMLTVKASDGQSVQVKMQQPIQENLEGIVEIHGIGQGRQVMCQNCVTFPLDYCKNFDMEAYDQAIRFIHTVSGSPWKFD